MRTTKLPQAFVFPLYYRLQEMAMLFVLNLRVKKPPQGSVEGGPPTVCALYTEQRWLAY